MKNILLVTFYYPPDNSSGSIRLRKLKDYLSRTGFHVSVLTVAAASEEGLTIEKNIKRVRYIDTVDAFSIKGRYISLVATPDRYLSWVFWGVRAGLELISEQNIKVLYSSSPPPSSHLLAYRLKKMTGLPWIAEFRDPWVHPQLNCVQRRFRLRIENWLEQKIVGLADHLVTTTKGLKTEIMRRHADKAGDEISVVYNGFDLRTLPLAKRSPHRDRLLLTHAGAVYGNFRNPLPLLKAIGNMKGCCKVGGFKPLLRFLGGGDMVESAAFSKQLAEMKISDYVEILPRVDYAQSLAHMLESDVLVLIQYTEAPRLQVPAKLYEYMGLGKPILAIISSGETEEILRGYPNAFCYHYDDVEGLTAHLTKWTRERPGVLGQRQVPLSFSRERQFRGLEAIIQRYL